MAQTSLSSSFWGTAQQRHAPAPPAHGRKHAAAPGSRQRMVAAERCRIFRYGKVICSTATAAPDIRTAEPLEPASEPTLSDLNTWIDSIEGLASTLKAAYDSSGKVCFVRYCSACCCSSSRCPVRMTIVVLLAAGAASSERAGPTLQPEQQVGHVCGARMHNVTGLAEEHHVYVFQLASEVVAFTRPRSC